MLTLRIHLDPYLDGNGPLRVIAGTHRHILNQGEVEDAVMHSTQAICAIEPGGLLIMRPLVLHASSPAIDPAHRRVIHIEFGSPTLPPPLRWAMTVDETQRAS